MRIRFTWRPEEWQEAMQLVSKRSRQKRDLPMMTWGILGVMSFGAVGDLFSFLQSRHVENPGACMLAGGTFTVAAGSGLVWLTRAGLQKRRSRLLPPMPQGEQEVVFQESGWSTCSNPAEDQKPALRSWQDVLIVHTGSRTLVARGAANTFAAVPLRVLSTDGVGHLQRLFSRKLRPVDQEELNTVSVA